MTKKGGFYACPKQECQQALSVKLTEQRLFNEIEEIFGESANKKILTEQLKPVICTYSLEKVLAYVVAEKGNLSRFMNKEFGSDYGQIRYFIAILNNNIPSYHFDEEEDLKEIEMVNIRYTPKKRRKCLNDYE